MEARTADVVLASEDASGVARTLFPRRIQHMTNASHYPNAPIKEAIIDLRVKPGDGLKLEQLERVGAGEEAYPKQDETYHAVGMMEVQAGVSASASAHQRQTGFKFTSGNEKYIWQARMDGFTFSRLAPYESWEPFRDEAKRLWCLYRERTAPAEVVRLAVRYVNRIDLPADCVDLKRYFRTSPEVSPELPQQLAAFFMQLRIPLED